MKKLSFLILLFFFNQAIKGNFLENDSVKTSKPFLYEKVYLHTDRELYTHGDELWFKSYLTSGINHKLIPGYKNIYVQLIYEDGVVFQNRLLLSWDGIAHGSFIISDTIPDGNYTIRAYTKYLENFGEESYFHKNITVSGSQKIMLPELKKPDKSTRIDVSFLPEGGSFILNAKNIFAFKVIDEKGKGISASGRILDEEGNEITRYKTSYKGMGTFALMPVEGKSYSAFVDGYPNFIYHFGKASHIGISVSCRLEEEAVLISFNRNFNETNPQRLNITGTHKGIELFNESKIITGFQESMKISKRFFPRGISRITVKDTSEIIVADRLVFIEGNITPSLELSINKNSFKTRDEVIIETKALLSETDTINSTFSVAVVNADYFAANGASQTIKSYLLLDSDLKGQIEAPAGYFLDDDTISSLDKLDLLMLVNGWSSYYWNELEAYKGMDLPGWADIGISVKGNVTGLWNKTPIPNCKVKLGPFSRNLLFEETLTDTLGRFLFERLYLKDQATIMINSQTRKDGRRTEISYNPTLKYSSSIPLESLLKVSQPMEIPLKFYREIYNRQISEKDFISQNILLNQVTVFGEKTEFDGHFRLYGEPDASFKITEKDNSYISVLDFLYGKVAGVNISGDEVRIRTASRNPLFILDGIKTDWNMIIHLPFNDIDKIEVLKSGFNLSIYGSEGADGVIAVYTKMGNTTVEIEKYMPGRIKPKITGFEKPKQFYSPKFTLENYSTSLKPDYRTTLFWEPNLKFENNKAQISFYTSDKLANYLIHMEGITKNGRIVSETTKFSVTE